MQLRTDNLACRALSSLMLLVFLGSATSLHAAHRAIPENSTGLPINASGYPILDSGVRRAEYVYWLDNDRVIFVRYEPYPGLEEVPLGGTTPIKLPERGFFIWDTKRGTVTPYQQDLGDTIGVCAFDHYVRLWGRADRKTADGRVLRVFRSKRGQFGHEELTESQWILGTPVPAELAGQELSGLTCQMYRYRDLPRVGDRGTFPLGEGDGYLLSDERDRSQPLYFLAPDKRIIELPIHSGQVYTSETRYALFSNSYLLSGMLAGPDYTNGNWPAGEPKPAWELSRDGKTRKISIPYGDWIGNGSVSLYPTKVGIAMTSVYGQGSGQPGAAGLYIVQGDRVEKIISGLVDYPTVSPDGCKIAFAHMRSSNAGSRDAPVSEIDGLSSQSLKMVRLCKE